MGISLYLVRFWMANGTITNSSTWNNYYHHYQMDQSPDINSEVKPIWLRRD